MWTTGLGPYAENWERAECRSFFLRMAIVRRIRRAPVMAVMRRDGSFIVVSGTINDRREFFHAR